jgi:aminoglycoside 6'-N-acetyltransferase
MAALTFRPLSRGDFSLLSVWLAAPHVRQWWQEDASPGAIEAAYGPVVDGADPGEVFIVESDGEAIGLIQRYQFADEPDWRRVMAIAGAPADSAGIDYLIGEESAIGKGLGPAIIETFVIDTWIRYPDVRAVAVNVNEGNRRSWRALEKCGFRRVWSGRLDSIDPSDAGVNFVYVLERPASL